MAKAKRRSGFSATGWSNTEKLQKMINQSLKKLAKKKKVKK